MEKNIILTKEMLNNISKFTIQALQDMEHNLRSVHIDLLEQMECLHYSNYMLESIWEYLNSSIAIYPYFLDILPKRFAKINKKQEDYLEKIRNASFQGDSEQIHLLRFICCIINDACWNICKPEKLGDHESGFLLNPQLLKQYITCMKREMHPANNYAEMISIFHEKFSKK